ncbi:MAG: tetratricopeptide repeat protein [Acidobacteriota bacterium]
MRAWPIHLSILVTACLAGCRTSPPPPPVDTLINQASTLDLAGQHDAAIAIFREVLQREPNSYKAHYGIGRALDLAGHYEDAREHFGKAIELASAGERDQATRMLGIAWTFAGDIAHASSTFQQVFDRQVADGNFGAASDVAYELGRVYLEYGDLNQAEAWYRKGQEIAGRESERAAWRVDLADMRLAHALARIAARRGHPDESHRQQAIVKRLLDKGGNDDQKIQYQYLLGYVDFYLGNYAAAQKALEQADQKDPFILLLLAQSHEALGHADEARDYYQRVLGSSSHAVNNAFARPIARAKLGA